jgi:hypothetical protein
MASELDARLAVHRAEQGFDRWLAHHAPLLSREVQTDESTAMLANLLRIADAIKIQLHALQEQLTQDIWEDRLAE